MNNSTARPSAAKVNAARPDGFPLFAHATNRWAKKVRGRLCYFGPVLPDGDYGLQAALQRWLAEKDDLLAGRVPQRNGRGLTLKGLIDDFLNAKARLVETGEIQRTTHLCLIRVGRIMADVLGRTTIVSMLSPSDFGRLRSALAAVDASPESLLVDIGRARSMFKWALDNELIERPPRYGGEFRKPAAGVLRRHRASKGSMMFEAAEIRRLLDAASEPIRTMVLLGINCGLGPADAARLPVHAIDLEGGWLDFPRPKTGIPRRAKLWRETLVGIRKALASRPAKLHRDVAGMVFVRPDGKPWDTIRLDRIKKEFRGLMGTQGVLKNRRAFYGLRRACETIGGAGGDQAAVDLIMGHAAAASDMGAVYRQRVDDERLVAVAERLHAWLWPAGSDGKGGVA